MKTYACDFETSVFHGQEETEVWSSAYCEVGCDYPEGVTIHTSIDETFKKWSFKSEKIVAYYHNLRFDGEFWLYYLMHDLGYCPAMQGGKWLSEKDAPKCSFIACISDMGLFYYIIIKTPRNIIELRDSLKLLPFTLDKIGKDFGLKHKKLDMEYEGERHAGGPISDEERAYIVNDVLVLSEALKMAFSEHMDKLTIGACCVDSFIFTIGGKDNFDSLFPQMGESIITGVSADKYIRRAYHGGFCYVKKGEAGRIQGKGFTLDVNSLYPSRMHSESGCRYPVGEPNWFIGSVPEEAKTHNRYYFVRFRCSFHIKPNMLPTVQIKGNPMYRSTVWLETSDIYNPNTGEYEELYIDSDGKYKRNVVELTMTCTDWKLFNEHYYIDDLEILDGCWFETELGIFDTYINTWRAIKTHSTGAKRQLAKLYLNNLYGKMASSAVSSFKVPYIGEEGNVQYKYYFAEDRKPAYIPVGAAITSYAREFTIRNAQKNYEIFRYADTDSLHCVGDVSEVKGVKLDDVEFNCWKHESTWEEGLFVRAKTYIEKIAGNYEITCAGMGTKSKKLVSLCLKGGDIPLDEKYNEEDFRFIARNKGMQLENFGEGLEVPGKLKPTHIKGGIVLKDTPFTIR